MTLFTLAFAFLQSCQEQKEEVAKGNDLNYSYFDSVSIRAMSSPENNVLWFAGSRGVFGYTTDNGATWSIDTLKHDGKPLHFRGVHAYPGGTALLVSIVEPAAVYRTSDWGKTWQMVYADLDSNAFFDALRGEDSTLVLVGDPDSNGLHVAISHDAGFSWQRMSVPGPFMNESPYAASNSNVSLSNGAIRIATGGPSGSRLYTSSDFGRSWTIDTLPLTKGGVMTGAYGVDAYGDDYMVVGGDWDHSEEKDSTYFDRDTRLSAMPKLPHCSAVRYSRDGNELSILAGRISDTNGVVYRFNRRNGEVDTLQEAKVVSLEYSPSGTLWIAGYGKILHD